MMLGMERVENSSDSIISPDLIYWTIIVSLCLDPLINLYLDLTKLRHVCMISPSSGIPSALQNHLNLGAFQNDRKCVIDKLKYNMGYAMGETFMLLVVLHFRLMYWAWLLTLPLISNWWPPHWNLEVGRSMAFIIVVTAFISLVGAPFFLYECLVLDQRPRLTGKKVFWYICAFLFFIGPVAVICFALVAAPGGGLLVFLFRIGGHHVIPWLWPLWAISEVVSSFCLLNLLLACGVNYTPMTEQPLRSRLEALALRTGFPLVDIHSPVANILNFCVMDCQCTYAFCQYQRIFLYDRLLFNRVQDYGCSDEEVEAVVLHEMGHWRMNHLAKSVATNLTVSFCLYYLLIFFYRKGALYQAFGFPEGVEMPVLLGVMMVNGFLVRGFKAAGDLLKTWVRKRLEFEADAFVVKEGQAEILKMALIKLNWDNHWAWMCWEPSLFERLEGLDQWQAGIIQEHAQI